MASLTTLTSIKMCRVLRLAIPYHKRYISAFSQTYNEQQDLKTEKYALVFPGQGSQRLGMGKRLIENFNSARLVVEEVEEALGVRLSSIMIGGTEEQLTLTENCQPAILTVSLALLAALKLTLTENCQPAILTVSLALLAALKERNPDIVTDAQLVLGHSLGEYSALVAAGSITLAQGAQLVRARGLAMQRCVSEYHTGMVAMMPCDYTLANQIAKEAERLAGPNEICDVANANSPKQTTISGTGKALDIAKQLATKRRVRKCIDLKVSCAFHSRVVEEAANEMALILKDTPILVPSPHLVANVTAKEVYDVDTIRQGLVDQITGTVQWERSISTCKDKGVTSYVELGERSVLGGLIQQCDKTSTT
eukprot:Ihof_evm7s313 gene=Ihof_evmTU7s313